MFKKHELNSIKQTFTQQNPIKAENELDKDKTVQNALDTFHISAPALNDDDEVNIVTILMTKDIFSDGSYLSMYAANNFFPDNSTTSEISQSSSDIDETNNGRTSPDKPVRAELAEHGILNLFGAHNNYSFFQHKSGESEDVITSTLDKPAALSPIPKALHYLQPNDHEDTSLSCLQL